MNSMGKMPLDASVVIKQGSFKIHELAALQRLSKRIQQSILDGKKILNKKAYILGSVEETVRMLGRSKPEAYSAILGFIGITAWTDDISRYIAARRK